MPGGVECLYEFILLHHVGVVAKSVCGGGARRGRQYPVRPNGPRYNPFWFPRPGDPKNRSRSLNVELDLQIGVMHMR